MATVSLGAHIVLNLYPKTERNTPIRILQEPRSLLVTRGEMYTEYLHSIEEVHVDENLGEDTIANWCQLSDAEKWKGDIKRQTRISLTFRDVQKVVKLRV